MRDRANLTGREGIPLEQAVYLHTKEPADICGLTDRGALTVGLKAGPQNFLQASFGFEPRPLTKSDPMMRRH